AERPVRRDVARVPAALGRGRPGPRRPDPRLGDEPVGALLQGLVPTPGVVCALFETLLADQDGLYDPADYNDRLLLGLKGTMSEAELHVLKGRMYQGLLNKAKRGEVFNHPPAGYVKLPTGSFALDPDEQVQSVIRLLFDQFERQGSINGLLHYLVQHHIRMPIRPHRGPSRGQLEWHRPNRVTLQNLLRHP